MRVAALRLAIPTVGSVLLFLTGCTSVVPVREGVLYRSGQLSTSQLETAVRNHDIRTVVNLRGRQPDAKWYQDQKQLLRELRVKQVDVPLDSAAPDADAVDALLATFKEEDKPILVHSYWSHGSAGLASGLYRVAVENESPDVARKELALWQTKSLPFIPGAQHDKFLAEWGRGSRSTKEMTAAKRKSDPALEDFGLDELDRPMKENRVAGRAPPRRFPWTDAPASARNNDESDAATVVLGKPKPLPDDRIADRSESRRY
jgi:protein tyrosine phosphatase (PTP) superfamily phosphohydrolase (DUF442 family)